MNINRKLSGYSINYHLWIIVLENNKAFLTDRASDLFIIEHKPTLRISSLINPTARPVVQSLPSLLRKHGGRTTSSVILVLLGVLFLSVPLMHSDVYTTKPELRRDLTYIQNYSHQTTRSRSVVSVVYSPLFCHNFYYVYRSLSYITQNETYLAAAISCTIGSIWCGGQIFTATPLIDSDGSEQ